MPGPTINDARPYTGYKRNEPFQFTLAASPLPLRWGAVSMPPGISVDDPPDWACTGVESTNVITAAGHNFTNGDQVYFTALTGGDSLNVNTPYFVRDVAANILKLAATKSGPALDFASDISSGVIRKVSTGVFSSPGIGINTQYLLNIWAEDGTGRTTIVVPVCISPDLYIAPPSGSVEEIGLPLTVDMKTLAVRVGKPGESSATTTSQVETLFTTTQSDRRMLVVYFERDGLQVDPAPTDVAIALKDDDFDPALVIDSDFEKAGEGSTARFYVPLILDGNRLADALERYQKSSGARFAARYEIQWKHEVSFKGNPLELVSSTQKFLVETVGEIIPN